MTRIKKLNKHQKAAIRHEDGPAVVFAGAGAGKTAVIEHRTARLLADEVDPTRILLLTFTNRAADEMLTRVAEQHPAARMIDGGTFHSWARKLLLHHGKAIGLRSNFTILDEDDAERLMSECGLAIADRRKPRNRPDGTTLVKLISHSRNNMVTLRKSLNKTAPNFEDQLGFVKAVAKAYRIAKIERSYVDFDDLLALSVKLLTNHHEIRRAVSSAYDYVMVDEFQDTNRIQARLIELVAGLDDPMSKRNIMVVTDPGQSMYRFRGAWYKNTDDFIARWQPAILPLGLNYRSTQAILDLANHVDRTQIDGKRRQLAAASSGLSAPLPSFVEHSSATDEARAVTNTILKHKENGIPIKDQAVLLRSVWQGRLLEAELIAKKIPYQLHGGRQITEAAHIKDVLAVLRVAENQKDSLALKRVLELLQGIGPVSSKEIVEKISDHNGGSFIGALSECLAGRTDMAKAMVAVFKAALVRSLDVVERVRRVSKGMRPILRQCPKYKENIEDRLKDLGVLPLIAQSFVTVRELLAALTLNGPDLARATIDKQRPTEEPLTLSTIHSAKGLEWQVVYVIGLNDGQIPSAKSIPKNVGEERRVFYVAITRAKRHLHLSRAEYAAYRSKRSPLSRFLTAAALGKTRRPAHQMN
jgi:DNA helicase-2/ATP-dependent DNA helicase PcrA